VAGSREESRVCGAVVVDESVDMRELLEHESVTTRWQGALRAARPVVAG
jgi:hypothetical protein